MPPRARKTTAAGSAAPTDAGARSQPRGNHGKYARSIDTAERDGQAARLKADGLTYTQIGDELGIDRSAAFRAVQRALHAAVVPAANLLRTREFARLEYLWECLLPGIEAGDTKSITEGRKVSESLRKLFDLDGPQDAADDDVDEHERSAIEKMLAEVDAYVAEEQAKIYRAGNG